jgi:hypothetical protein
MNLNFREAGKYSSLEQENIKQELLLNFWLWTAYFNGGYWILFYVLATVNLYSFTVILKRRSELVFNSRKGGEEGESVCVGKELVRN